MGTRAIRATSLGSLIRAAPKACLRRHFVQRASKTPARAHPVNRVRRKRNKIKAVELIEIRLRIRVLLADARVKRVYCVKRRAHTV